jgi:uncharacterized LabA/DUF88 family protein
LLATAGFLFSGGSVTQKRIAVLMDGSNLLSSLGRIGLGYPNLERFIAALVGAEVLASARFYGAPPVNVPIGPSQTNYYQHWMKFMAANRNVAGLGFYRGYREKNGREKAVDVALAVDLIHGAHIGAFDRAVVVGGDGDHQYAVEVAKGLSDLTVVVVEQQKYSGMKRTGVPIRELSRNDLLSLQICAPGVLAPVPV